MDDQSLTKPVKLIKSDSPKRVKDTSCLLNDLIEKEGRKDTIQGEKTL